MRSFTLFKEDDAGAFYAVIATVESSSQAFSVFSNSTTLKFQFDTDGTPGSGGTGSGGTARGEIRGAETLTAPATVVNRTFILERRSLDLRSLRAAVRCVTRT